MVDATLLARSRARTYIAADLHRDAIGSGIFSMQDDVSELRRDDRSDRHVLRLGGHRFPCTSYVVNLGSGLHVEWKMVWWPSGSPEKPGRAGA